MNKPLFGQKTAVLVANGFNETDLTFVQRTLQSLGASVRIVSMENGLVNSWRDNVWGLNFAADNMLSSALAADFSILFVPGGQKSIDKLKLTGHTGRFLKGFLDAGKPAVLMGEALELLMFYERASERTVAGPAHVRAAAEEAGASWSGEPYAIHGTLMTVAGAQSDAAFEESLTAFLTESSLLTEAA